MKYFIIGFKEGFVNYFTIFFSALRLIIVIIGMFLFGIIFLLFLFGIYLIEKASHKKLTTEDNKWKWI